MFLEGSRSRREPRLPWPTLTIRGKYFAPGRLRAVGIGESRGRPGIGVWPNGDALQCAVRLRAEVLAQQPLCLVLHGRELHGGALSPAVGRLECPQRVIDEVDPVAGRASTGGDFL